MALVALGSGWTERIRRVVDALSSTVALPTISDATVATIARLLDLVVVWNARTDLTAARGPDQLVDLYVADALVLAAHSQPGKWVDVGSGAGAPGLTLALLSPELDLTLVEPKTKRVAFLRTVIGELELPRVSVIRARSDAVPSDAFSVATSRATLAPAEWLAEGARLAQTTWVLLARDEPPPAENFSVVADIHYPWPLTGASRRAVAYRKA